MPKSGVLLADLASFQFPLYVEWYGYDPQAPPPSDDGLSSVKVSDAEPNLPDDMLEQLKTQIDPYAHSDNYGIDLFLRALDLITEALAI
eukprot:gene11156-20040_t